MNTRTYGFALLGAGVIAPTHCRALARLPNARLVACCDLERDRAEQLAATFSIPHVYTDLHAMLARGDVDVVEIVTWSGAHAEHGLAAAAAGKHVIITKPLDIRLAHIDRLIAACRARGVTLGATHQFRGYPAYRALKAALDEGRLGRVYLGNAFVKWWRDPAYYRSAAWRGTWNLDGGGALMNQAVHYVDLLTWLLGPPRSLRGYVATLRHAIEVEDCASASLRFQSGALGTIQAATCTYRGLPARLEVHAERGNVIIEQDRAVHWDVEGDPPLAPPSASTGAEADPRTAPGDAVTAHAEQIADVLAAIEEGREPALNGTEARRAVEIVLGIYHSAWSGESVLFPLDRDPMPPAVL